MAPTSSSSSLAPSTRRGHLRPQRASRVKWLLLREREELNAKDAAYRQALFRLSPRLSSLWARGQDASWSDPRAPKPGLASPLWSGPKPVPMRTCGILRKATGERVKSGSSSPHRAMEYRTGGGADHQAEVSQAPDVWTSPYRSLAFAGAPCGMMSSYKRTQPTQFQRKCFHRRFSRSYEPEKAHEMSRIISALPSAPRSCSLSHS